MSINPATRLTAKQENFAQSIAAGMTQADAYREAYDAENMQYMPIAVEASRLVANPKIALRVETLREPVIAELRYGLKEAMLEAAEAFTVAKDKENGGAMVAAVQLRSKLNGLLVEKTEDLTDPFKRAMSNMTAEKAQQLLDAMEQIQVIRAKAAGLAVTGAKVSTDD